jgi:hypothetical protein
MELFLISKLLPLSSKEAAEQAVQIKQRCVARGLLVRNQPGTLQGSTVAAVTVRDRCVGRKKLPRVNLTSFETKWRSATISF